MEMRNSLSLKSTTQNKSLALIHNSKDKDVFLFTQSNFTQNNNNLSKNYEPIEKILANSCGLPHCQTEVDESDEPCKFCKIV